MTAQFAILMHGKLRGKHSVHHIRVNYNKISFSLQQGAPYRICSALVPLKDDNTLLAKATFTQGSVRGAIYFVSQYFLINDHMPSIVMCVYQCCI